MKLASISLKQKFYVSSHAFLHALPLRSSSEPERGIAAEDMLFYPVLFDHRSGDMRLCNARPQRRPESDHQVHASGRHAGFPQASNQLNQGEWVGMLKQIELQIGVRASPQSEDPTLCNMHRP